MIVVTGATGNVGSALVGDIAASGGSVRALTRDARRARFPGGVEVVEGDLGSSESLVRSFKGAEALFLLLPGSGDPAVIAESARRAGVERIVLVSTLIAHTHPDTVMGRGSLRNEQAVRESGLQWTVLRPGEFASNALWWLPEIRAEGVVRTAAPNGASPVIHPADIAAVGHAALTEDGHHGRTYELTGPEAVTKADQVRMIGEATGRELSCVGITVEQARRDMERNMPTEVADSLLEIMNNDGDGAESRVLPTVEEVTGSSARTFRQWVRENTALFR